MIVILFMPEPLNRKVLIIDEERQIRELLSDFFYFNGYKVILADNGREALDILMDKSCSLLIIGDISDASEVELIIKIRSVCVSLPIIGMSIENKESKFLRAGANYFLLKPFIIHHLKSIVSSIFSR
jgi:DNA-binding response OmpR family regulator